MCLIVIIQKIMQATSILRANSFAQRAIAFAVLAQQLLQGASGNLTKDGIVSSDSLYKDATKYCPSSRLNELVDGKFFWTPVSSGTQRHCCGKTDPQSAESWYNVDMRTRRIVQTVFIIRRESDDYIYYDEDLYDWITHSNSIAGSAVYVGDNTIPQNNTLCNGISNTGPVQCGGKIGRYIGIYRATQGYLQICQIRAYSYAANSFPLNQFEISNIGIPAWASHSVLVWQNTDLKDGSRTMSINGNPIYYNMDFGVQRYVHLVLILNHNNQAQWFVTVGNQTGSSISSNPVFGQKYLDHTCDYEIQVGVYARSVGVYALQDAWNGYSLMFKWFAVFTTASDCSGSFDWSSSRTDWRILITSSAQTITGLLEAKIDDCAVFHDKLVLADGSALPSQITYDVYTKMATVEVGASQAPITITVKACANLNDGITQAKSECKETVIKIFKYADSLAFAQSPFTCYTEQSNQAVNCDLPQVLPNPTDAEMGVLSYALIGAPGFLTVMNIGAKLVVNPSATVGTHNFQVTVTESNQNKSATVNGTVVVYVCQPTGFAISPSSLTLRVAGTSITSTWSSDQIDSACGTYSVAVEAQFAHLITISGNQILAQAPFDAFVGTFDINITLSIDNNMAHTTTAILTVHVERVDMTQLNFSPTTPFDFETQLQSSALLFDFPAIFWLPQDADKAIFFQLKNAPDFLTLQQSDSTAKGKVNIDVKYGTYAYQVLVEDRVSNLSAVIDATLTIYSCEPKGFELSQSSVSVSILGPSKTITFKFSSPNQACGSYSVSVQKSLNLIIKVDGQKLVVFAPETASIGDFNPVITIKNEKYPRFQKSVSLALQITQCMVESIKFSKQPTTFMNLDLNTYNQTFSVPFQTQQTPQCKKQVIFTLFPSSLSFLSVEASTFSDGRILAKNFGETKETTYSATLRAQVDGQYALSNFFVGFKNSTEPIAEPEPQEDQVLKQQILDWKSALNLQPKLLEGKWKHIPPNPYIDNLKANGTITISFRSEVYIVPNLTMINNGTILLENFEKYNITNRKLGQTTVNDAQKIILPVLQVEVIAGIESKAEDLSYKWNVTQENAKNLLVQLYFDYPLSVSTNPVSSLLLTSLRSPTEFE